MAGIFTDQQSDEAFNKLLEELRSVAKKRTVVYAAEERALMVMLEGEQEEERRKELEGKQKRERDKQMQMKRKVDIMLFGGKLHSALIITNILRAEFSCSDEKIFVCLFSDDTPPDPFMQPFRQYYTQAEHSLPALVQIRYITGYALNVVIIKTLKNTVIYCWADVIKGTLSNKEIGKLIFNSK